MDDPYDWDVSRVIRELCTDQRSWKPMQTNKIPDPKELSAKITECDVDGLSLLCYSQIDHGSYQGLFEALGIKKLPHRIFIMEAVKQLQSRSPKYQERLRGSSSPAPNPDSRDAVMGGTPADSAATAQTGSPDAVDAVGPVQPPSPTLAAANGEPPPKKRRLAPTLVSAVPVHSQPIEAPSFADDISWGRIADPPTSPPASVEFDIPSPGLEFGLIEEALSDDDGSFSFAVEPSRVPSGLKIRTSLEMKKFLGQPSIQANQRLRRVRDPLPGFYLDGDDEELPLFGESDEEYDSDTLAEIKAEEEERARHIQEQTSTLEDRTKALDDLIASLEGDWRQNKLPKLEPTAYKLFTDAARKGDRPARLRIVEREIQRLTARITALCNPIKKDSQYNVADILKLRDSFEVTVFDRAEQVWRKGVLLRSSEPQKPRTQPRKPKAPKIRVATEAIGDVDILTSESEDDFIVSDDEDSEHAGKDEQADSPSLSGPADDGDSHVGIEAEADAMDIDPAISRSDDGDHESDAGDKASAVRDHGATADVKMEDPDERPGGSPLPPDSNPRPPPVIIDLTSVEDTPPRKPGAAPLAHPALVGLPTNDPKKIADFGREHWCNLKNGRGLVVTLLFKLKPRMRRLVLAHANQAKPEKLWEQFVVPCFDAKSKENRGALSKSTEERFPLTLTRLFDAFTSFSVCVGGRDIAVSLGAGTVKRIRANEAKFPGFCRFLADLDDLFPSTDANATNSNAGTSKKPPADEHGTESNDPDEDEDEDDDDVVVTPSRRGRPKKKDAQAQKLRDLDRQRMEQQQSRTLALQGRLREQVALGAISGQQLRLIINEAKEESQGFVYVTDKIAGHIKPHQIQGVRFMWNQIINSSNEAQGCLLAHTMGLGKTMQVICLLVAIAEAAASEDSSVSSQIPKDLREFKTLVLCPAGLVRNWQEELRKWAPEGVLGPLTIVESECSPRARERLIKEWASNGGVLVIGYTLYRVFFDEEDGVIANMLHDTPNIVVGDEAHFMKNPKSKITIATSGFRTQRRIAMTGSPLGNSVEDYFAMIDWVAPNYLGPIAEFRSFYATPIKEGLYASSLPGQKRRALKLLKALKDVVAPKVHRMTMHALKDQLPPKTEFVLFLPLTQLQLEVYEAYMAYLSRPEVSQESTSSMMALFGQIGLLNLLLAHPGIFLSKLNEMKAELDAGLPKRLAKKQRDAATPSGDGEERASLPRDVIGELIRQVNVLNISDHNLSCKIVVLLQILEEAKKAGDKVLVFSSRLSTIDFLELLFRTMQKPYCRLDGSTKIASRQDMVANFNRNRDEVYLISTRAGGLGLNIQGANRVVIMDFGFTPINETQAIGRAYRIGQPRPVFVYWLVVGGTYEAVLHEMLVFKSQLASRVVDKKNLKAFANRSVLMRPPETIKPEDLGLALGRDDVLDAVLKSLQNKEVCKIIMGSSFEEEEPEQALGPEELLEVDAMIARTKANHNGPAPYFPFLGAAPPPALSYRPLTGSALGNGTGSTSFVTPVPLPVPSTPADRSRLAAEAVRSMSVPNVGNGLNHSASTSGMIPLRPSTTQPLPLAPQQTASTVAQRPAMAPEPAPPLPPSQSPADAAAAHPVVPETAPSVPALTDGPITGSGTDWRPQSTGPDHTKFLTPKDVLDMIQAGAASLFSQPAQAAQLGKISEEVASTLQRTGVRGLPARARVRKFAKVLAEEDSVLNAVLDGTLKAGDALLKDWNPTAPGPVTPAVQPGSQKSARDPNHLDSHLRKSLLPGRGAGKHDSEDMKALQEVQERRKKKKIKKEGLPGWAQRAVLQGSAGPRPRRPGDDADEPLVLDD